MSCSKLRTADDTRETARPASPARPVRPHAVDVVLGHERQVIVDDERQLHNAEPARGKVGGDEHHHPADLEVAERPVARALGLVAVNDRRPYTGLFERLTLGVG